MLTYFWETNRTADSYFVELSSRSPSSEPLPFLNPAKDMFLWYLSHGLYEVVINNTLIIPKYKL
jgi:hypothetical protein